MNNTHSLCPFVFLQEKAAELTEEKLPTFQQQINALQTVTKVSVVLRADYYSGMPIRIEGQRDESDNLLKSRVYGCNYSNQLQDDLPRLLSLLKQHMRPSNNIYLPYADLAIYLTFANDEEGHILLGRRYRGEAYVDGEMRLPPHYKPVILKIDTTIHRDIYNWITVSFQWKLYPETGYKRHNVKFQERKCKKLMQSDYYRNSPKQTCASAEDVLMTLPLDECPVGWRPPMQGLPSEQ